MEYLVHLLQSFILGIIQGITEFLPISSTAHLHIAAKLFGWTLFDNKPFIGSIQFGSVAAVVIYFWKDLRTIFAGSWQAYQAKDWGREEWRIFAGVAIGTIPILIGGFLLKGVLNQEGSLINSVQVIAIASIVMAILMGVAEKIGSRDRDFKQLQIQDGILMGLGEMLALVPGVSRSGSTLTAGLFLGLTRRTAARFSFLLGIPALTIATFYEFFKEVLGKLSISYIGFVIVGAISAFIFSYLAIAWLLKFFQTNSTWIFVWYRLAFGLLILIGAAFNLLK